MSDVRLTGDERFKQRVDYLVAEMKEVQDARGNGYLGAIIGRAGTDGASFEIQVDGTRLAAQSIVDRSAEGFYDARIALPAGLLAGKETITVRFQSTGDGRIPTVFGVRTIRADAQP